MSEWQPIDTAPRNGSYFLGWVHAAREDEDEDGRAEFIDESCADICWWNDGKEFADASSFAYGGNWAVTHWMPLPGRPAST